MNLTGFNATEAASARSIMRPDIVQNIVFGLWIVKNNNYTRKNIWITCHLSLRQEFFFL